jgi:hypothetical protein
VVTTDAGVTTLRETATAWYDGFPGQAISLGMFVVLIVVTFLLARWGANMQKKESAGK